MAGMFFPRTVASLGVITITGREIYRYGYMTKEGPNSYVREVGAVSLNIAELFTISLIGVVALRYFFGPFFNNRRFVKRFKLGKVDIKLEEVMRKLKDGR